MDIFHETGPQSESFPSSEAPRHKEPDTLFTPSNQALHQGYTTLHALTIENAEEAYQQGVKLVEEKQVDAARPYFERALQLDPNHVDARLRLSYVQLWQGHPDEAIAGFEEVLKAAPDYEDARTGITQALARKAELKREAAARRKKSDYEVCMIASAQKRIRCKLLESAYMTWNQLWDTFPEEVEYRYQTGLLASWTGRWEVANSIFHGLLEEGDTGFSGRAHLALAQQYLLLWQPYKTQYHLGALLDEAPDSGEGWLSQGRLYLQGISFCAARAAFLRAYYLIKDEETKAIAWRNFYDASLLTTSSFQYTGLYARQLEVDNQTHRESARIYTALQRLRCDGAPREGILTYAEAEAGYQREYNIQGEFWNYNANLLRATTGINVLATPYFRWFGGVTCKNGVNRGNHLFPFHQKVTAEPWLGADLHNADNRALLSYVRDSYIIKNYQELFSLFLLRNTLEGFYEHQFLPHTSYVGLSGYGRVYEDDILNVEGRARVWVTMAIPPYSDTCSLRYQFDVGGFRDTDTNYYSFQKQWEHFLIATVRTHTAHVDYFELSYLHSWRHTRDLNQPINSTFYLPRQFIFTNKVMLKVRKIFKRGFDVNFDGLYYWDTQQYHTFSVMGNIRWIF